MNFEGCAWGDSKQPSALYELYPATNTCDSKLVKTLLIEIQKKRHKTIMSNIEAFPEQRKLEIQTLWNHFKDSFSSEEKNAIKKEITDLLESWQEYKKLIQDDKLELEHYTNILGNEEATLPGGYLCNFLERTTSSVFGSSKPGTALTFGIKMNDDGKTFTITKNLKKGEKANQSSEIDLADEFGKIRSIFKEIIGSSAALNKANIVELSSYSAKQIIRKLAVLDNLNDFLFIYSDDVIDSLHSEFVVSSVENSNLVKNFEVRQVLNKMLELSECSDLDSVLLSKFIWKYANTKGLADENTPNVILYGPPGTGKTYAVMQSLDFLCQGDRSRYEVVQFHPSFTYEDFIDGIKPKGVSNDGNIKFELVDGIFKSFCKRANKNRSQNYYFIVDEINRANLSSVFGETLLCIEKDYRHREDSTENLIKTQYSTLIEAMINDDKNNESLAYIYDDKDKNAYFGVPSNVFFIGMMNDVDKSIDAFDLALRRRFKWIRKDCDYQVIENEVKFKNGNESFTNIGDYEEACRKLNNYINEKLGMGVSYEFGHSFFMKITGIAKSRTISRKNLKTLFELHLKPTLKEYLRSMYAESELDTKVNETLAEFINPIKSTNES